MPEKTSLKQPSNSTNWSKNNLGSLWLKQGKSNKYLSGKIVLQDSNGETITQNIIVFKNKFKEKDNQPDYVIFKPFEKDYQESSWTLPHWFVPVAAYKYSPLIEMSPFRPFEEAVNGGETYRV